MQKEPNWQEAKGLDLNKLDMILLKTFAMEDVKMVIVARDDAKIQKGKLGAQCGHGAVEAFRLLEKRISVSKFWKKVHDTWNWVG